MPEPKGNGHFRMFTAISTTMPGRSTGQHRECPNFPQMRRLPWALIRSNLAYGSYRPPVWFRAQRPRKATCGTRGASRPTYYITSNDAIRRQALDCENTAVDVDLRTCD